MKNVLVVGSINMDFTISTERMPELGETIIGKEFFSGYGGKGVNQAVALARQGAAVKFLGAVGDDLNGRLCIENLKKNKIDFRGRILTDIATGVAVITVCKGDNCIILDGGANLRMTLDMIEEQEALYAWADMVVMQLEIPVETVLKSCQMAKRNGCICVLNPAPVKELPKEMYPYIDIFIPNIHEAKAFTGITCDSPENCRKAVEVLKKKGIGQVIITLGDKGCVYHDEGALYFQKAFPVNAVDTTAAGDSFIGGLCSELLTGGTIEEAVEYASRVSAVTVSRCGAVESIPFREEIECIKNSK